MTDVDASFATLSSERVQLTLSTVVGKRPSIVHWGQVLRGVEAADLRLMSTRQWVFGGPALDLPSSISNELGGGLMGPSGFLGHRDGLDWAAVFVTERVERRGASGLSLHCQDENSALAIVYHFDLHADTSVLTVVTEVTNLGEKEFTVDWMAAAALPIDERLTRVRGFTGRWAGEFEREDVDLQRGSYVRENKAGRTSHDSFPGFYALAPTTSETAGPCAGFHLGWSGNNRVRVDRHSDGRSFAQMGELLFPGEMRLGKGESYRTPTSYAAWSDEGLNGVSRSFHRHLSDEILDARTLGKARPVHFNTWEAVYFDHSDEKLMALADQAASVGAERFVLDDGWFGGRRSDQAGLGDWTVSKDVYPDGLRRLVNHVRQHGMEFGIWFEPEMVNPDSDLFREHPDWVLEASGVDQVPFRHQYTLDLTKPEVSDYLFRAISAIVSEYSVDYIKWDMNRDTHHPGSGGQRPAMHLQTHAVYRLIERLREAHPALEIESCSSGGARTDFGILAHTDRLWTSDNNDALSRQAIQRGASYFFPPKVLGTHVGPKVCHITGRVFDMQFRVGTAIFGHMGMEVDLSGETEEDLEFLRRGIALHKEHRELLHTGEVVRLEAPAYVSALGVVAKDRSEALFSCATVEEHGTTLPNRLRFSGLDPDRSYRLKLVWPEVSPSITVPSIIEHADLYGSGIAVRGSALEVFGLQLPVAKPNTCLIFHLETNVD